PASSSWTVSFFPQCEQAQRIIEPLKLATGGVLIGQLSPTPRSGQARTRKRQYFLSKSKLPVNKIDCHASSSSLGGFAHLSLPVQRAGATRFSIQSPSSCRAAGARVSS